MVAKVLEEKLIAKDNGVFSRVIQTSVILIRVVAPLVYTFAHINTCK